LEGKASSKKRKRSSSKKSKETIFLSGHNRRKKNEIKLKRQKLSFNKMNALNVKVFKTLFYEIIL